MGTESKYIWMDGQLVEYEKATVHFLTSAFHFGLGVFEGIRCYDTDRGPAVFRLMEHMERLVDSAMILGFRELPFTAAQMAQATKETIKANDFKECYIRPVVYHVTPNPNLTLNNGTAKVGIATWDWGKYLGVEALERGIRMNISSYTRHHPNVSMTKAKITGNYVNSALAKTESLRMGFDEAIMLDPQGYVAECTGENILLVRRGVIYTPPLAAVLEGITRDTVIVLAAELGFKVVETPISRDMLYIADEVFVCGTAAEVVAVREVDFRTIGEGKMGPVTRQLQKVYFDAVQGRSSHSAQWLDYVNG